MQNNGTTDVLLVNDGAGNFANETATRLGSFANVAFGTSVEIHDVDNDGDNDIVKMSTLYPVAPFPVAVTIDIGVASPSAHGQAMINTATALMMA